MEELILFFKNYGLVPTIIAFVGIVLLGIMKYCNLFKKIEEKSRHYIYLAISIGISIIGSIVYLLIVKQFEITYICTLASAIFALNQVFYNIFKVTSINDLGKKCLDLIKKIVSSIAKKDAKITTEDSQGENGAEK